MSKRLKTSLWVEAHIRACFAADRPAFVVARGDADRGGILLKIDGFEGGITLYERTMDFDGNNAWRCLVQGADAADVADRINRKRAFDEDLWVLEIEDLRQTYQPDATVLPD